VPILVRSPDQQLFAGYASPWYTLIRPPTATSTLDPGSDFDGVSVLAQRGFLLSFSVRPHRRARVGAGGGPYLSARPRLGRILLWLSETASLELMVTASLDPGAPGLAIYRRSQWSDSWWLLADADG
jgi:hypothetical protein